MSVFIENDRLGVDAARVNGGRSSLSRLKKSVQTVSRGLESAAGGGAKEMVDRRAADLGDWLRDEHAARRPFRSAPGLETGDLALAYDAQDVLIAHWKRERNARSAGHKIGLTTPRMQEMCGIAHPIAGTILSDRVFASPVTLDTTRFVRLGLESELAVRFGGAIDGAAGAPDAGTVMAAIDAVAPAFEIIEDRAADYKVLDMASLVADDSWNAGLVLGPISPARDLADLPALLAINGAHSDEGNSNDVLGHPLTALSWLAGHLGARRRRIEAGEWVLTGSIVPTRFPRPGDDYAFTIEGLGTVVARMI